MLTQTLAEIITNLVQLRRLQPLVEIDSIFMTRTELEAILKGKLEEEREQVLKSQELLTILNLIPENLNLYQLYLDLLAEQALGFYDLDTGKLHVIEEAQRLRPNGEVTFATELVFALQQQHFDIRSLYEAAEQNSDTQAALAALSGGDSYVTAFQYMDTFLTPQERQEVLQSDTGSPVLEQAPYAIQKSFLFEIEAGIPFVMALQLTDPLGAVNQAFINPPVSTEQILHPEKYFHNELPISVSLPDIVNGLGAGWSQTDSNVMGEFFLRTYLETGVGERFAADAAAGWGGDRYILLRDAQDQRILVLLIAWDTLADAREFRNAATVSPIGASYQRYVSTSGTRTLFIVAPAQALIEAVRAQFPGDQWQ